MAAQLADLLSKARLPALQPGPLLSSLRAPRTENNLVVYKSKGLRIQSGA